MSRTTFTRCPYVQSQACFAYIRQPALYVYHRLFARLEPDAKSSIYKNNSKRKHPFIKMFPSRDFFDDAQDSLHVAFSAIQKK